MKIGLPPLVRVLGAALLLCSSQTPAASQVPPPEEPLRVLVRIAPPFVIDEGNGVYSGVSIELWRAMAEKLQLRYTLEPAGLEEMLTEVAAGRAAVGVGATTVTAERERSLEFTHPFLSTGLAIAARSSGGSWTAALERLISAEFARAAGTLVLLLLIVGFVVWAFERRANPEEFSSRPGSGLWSGFWFAAVSMTTVGYGDKAPRSVGGRIVALVWMFTSVIVISFFTAAIATALTVQTLAAGIDGPADLPRVDVGAVANTTSSHWLRARDITPETFDDPRAALRALAEGEIDAVVHDEPILRWLLRKSDDDRITVLPRVIERQDYAFVLPPDDPRRESINHALLEEIEGDRFERSLEQFLGR